MPAFLSLAIRTASRLVRVIVPIAIAGACLWLVSLRLEGFSFALFLSEAKTVPLICWAGALAATYLSFWALGRYDALAHRHFETNVPVPRARFAGSSAVAISQTLGFGLFTGTLVRWRLIPGLSLGAALRITSFAAVTFLFGLAAELSLTALILPGSGISAWVGALGLCAVTAGLAVVFLHPTLDLARWHIRLPSLPALSAIGFWTVLDTVAAALALFILMPASSDITFIQLFPAYLAALGVALISGTPGGVGPFELMLLTLLPTGDAAQVLSGIIAFRLVYFAIPALIAGSALLRRPHKTFRRRRSDLRPPAALPHERSRSETAVLRQSDGKILFDRGDSIALIETAQVSVGLFDPLTGRFDRSLQMLTDRARATNRVACLYKCGPRSAVRARQFGWQVQRIAREAILSPARFDLNGSTCRQLRRKLRHAEKAGIDGVEVAHGLPFDLMERLDLEWQQSHGRPQGLTMGRYDPGYVSTQRVFLAWQGENLIGFITFHASDREWCLDLMRVPPEAPDGTAHLLVCKAIKAARANGIPRLSLAALPDHALCRWLKPGLRQFKTAFAPYWQPLYLAAPDAGSLALAAADIARAVHAPGEVPMLSAGARAEAGVEQNEFALPRAL